MKRGQKGFTVVETLLVLILISIIGFTGYYVYHSQKNSNSSYNNAAQSSSQTPANTSDSSNKFVFKELGVEFNPPNSLKGLSYAIFDGTLYLSDSAFKDALNKCSDTNTASGDALSASFTAISKANGKYPVSANPVTDGTLLKQFADFYISYGVPNGNACSDQTQSQNLKNTADKERGYFTDAFKATASEVK